MAVTLEETQVITDQANQSGTDVAISVPTVGETVIVVACVPGADEATLAVTLGGQAVTELSVSMLTGFVSRSTFVGYRVVDGTEATQLLNVEDQYGNLSNCQTAAWVWSGVDTVTLEAVTGEGGLDSYGDGSTPENITVAAVTGGTDRKALVLVWGQTTDLSTTPTLSTPTGYSLGDTDIDLSGTNRAVAIACSADAASTVGATYSTLDNSAGAGAIPYFDDSGSVVVTMTLAGATSRNPAPKQRARRVRVKALPYIITTAQVKKA